MKSKMIRLLLLVLVSLQGAFPVYAAKKHHVRPGWARLDSLIGDSFTFAGKTPLKVANIRGVFGEWIAVGKHGTVYCSRGASHQVWERRPDGKVALVAGRGTPGDFGNGGPAVLAALTTPEGLAVGPDGSLYIADFGANKIWRVDASGIITAFAGTGVAGFSGDGGPAVKAQLNHPLDLAIGPKGSVFVVDQGNCRIRKISHSGIITTIAGNGMSGFSGDGGPSVKAEFNSLSGIAVDSVGNIYVCDWGNRRVRRITPNDIVTTFAGDGYWNDPGTHGDGGPAVKAELSGPIDVTIGSNGTVYIDDDWDCAIRRVGQDGIITTFVGCARPSVTNHELAHLPEASTIGPEGNLYFSEDLIGVDQPYGGIEGIIHEVEPAGTQYSAKQ